MYLGTVKKITLHKDALHLPTVNDHIHYKKFHDKKDIQTH